jgi:hypothetical protein
MSLVSDVATGVADAQKALASLDAQKQQIVDVLQSHIADHQKQAALHAAEVAAAQNIILQAYPNATAAQAQAAAFVLTSHSTWVSGVVNFLGRNWRYVALGVIVLGVVAACHAGLVKV